MQLFRQKLQTSCESPRLAISFLYNRVTWPCQSIIKKWPRYKIDNRNGKSVMKLLILSILRTAVFCVQIQEPMASCAPVNRNLQWHIPWRGCSATVSRSNWNLEYWFFPRGRITGEPGEQTSVQG